MVSTAREFADLRKLTPAEAVAYLVQRAKLTETFAWQDL